MSDIRIDDDGFLVGDGEQERTEAENVLMREIKTDTTTIISLMKGTQRLQRDALKAAQGVAKNKGNQSNNSNNGNVSPRVNLQHPNRANGANNQGQRVNLQHPNRPPINNGSNGQQSDTARPRVQQNQGGNAGAPTPTPTPPNNPNSDTARVNRQRDANGRFIGGDNADSGSESESAQRRGNRDSRGRFVGGDGSAAERSTASRITDSLKDLNNTLNVNANTDRIDPTIDAIKELGSIASVGIDAGKKALSVSNTLIAKPAMALGRGIKGLFKPKTDVINSPVAWYKRIWRTLERGNRQDQTQHAQEQRRLDELIRGQQRGSGDSGLLLMLGLGLAALLAALKKGGDLFNNLIPDFLKKQDNQSPVPVVGAPKVRPPVSALPPTRTQAMLQRLSASPVGNAARWLSETKVGQTINKFLKRLPFISSAIEAGAGGINAVNIANDANLTEEQKQRKQSENAGQTGGAIVGGLGGATAGAALGAKLGALGGPIGIAIGGIVGGLVGGWLGTDAGRIVGNKIGGWVDDLRKADIAGKISQAWTGFIDNITPSFSGIKESIVDFLKPKAEKPIDIIKNPPTMKMSPNEPPVPIVGNVYADKKSELYKNYQKWREADTDGKGVITLDDFKKSKIAKNNPNLLKQFEPVSVPKKQDAKGFNKDKAKSIQSVANRLGINPNDLAQIISFETGGTFDPAQKNLAGGSARGLIQFMPSTAKDLDTTTEALAAMSFDEQMVYVEKYLKKRGIGKNGKTSLPDIYDAVLGSGYKKGSKEYAANKGVDADKNGVISKGEAVNSKAFAPHRQKQFFAQVATVTPKAITTPTANMATNSVPSMKTAPVNAVKAPNVQSVPSVQAQESPRRLDNTPTPIKVSMPKPLVGQNISDRGIAHIVTGGIGEAM